MNIKLYRIALPGTKYETPEVHKENFAKYKVYTDILGVEMLPQPDWSNIVGSYCGCDYFKDKEVVISQDQALELMEHVPVEIVQVVRLDVASMFNTVADKPMTMAGGTNTFNQHCVVHMPGNTLTTYNQLMLVEDSCTDVMQNHLNGGWRIITVCPQNNQRRPDYILGRFNPDLVSGNGAARG